MAEPAPGPYRVIYSKTGSGNNTAHVYIEDANGRKIAAVWGPWEQKCATAELLASAWELREDPYLKGIMEKQDDD